MISMGLATYLYELSSALALQNLSGELSREARRSASFSFAKVITEDVLPSTTH